MNTDLGMDRTLIIIGINARVPTVAIKETDVLFSSAKLGIKNTRKKKKKYEEERRRPLLFNHLAGTGPVLGNGFLNRGFS